MLNIENYLEIKSWIRKNQVSDRNRRFWVIDSEKEYVFEDYYSLPSWLGKSIERFTSFNKTETKFFGLYFFLSEDLIHHERQVYTFYDLVSDFGGLY